jgi:hypothetical protein
MKTGANVVVGSTPRRPLLALCFLLPLLMGGCPEFRNDVVSTIETATTSALFGTENTLTITRTARESLVNAAIDLIFDQFRSDTFD